MAVQGLRAPFRALSRHKSQALDFRAQILNIFPKLTWKKHVEKLVSQSVYCDFVYDFSTFILLNDYLVYLLHGSACVKMIHRYYNHASQYNICKRLIGNSEFLLQGGNWWYDVTRCDTAVFSPRHAWIRRATTGTLVVSTLRSTEHPQNPRGTDFRPTETFQYASREEERVIKTTSLGSLWIVWYRLMLAS